MEVFDAISLSFFQYPDIVCKQIFFYIIKIYGKEKESKTGLFKTETGS